MDRFLRGATPVRRAVTTVRGRGRGRGQNTESLFDPDGQVEFQSLEEESQFYERLAESNPTVDASDEHALEASDAALVGAKLVEKSTWPSWCPLFL